MPAISKPQTVQMTVVSNKIPPLPPSFLTLCFFMSAIILRKARHGGSDWISREVLSLHFSQTLASAFLFSLQVFSGALALALSKCWRHSTESWESMVQGWGAVVISHLTVHYIECRSFLSGGGTQRYDFQFCGGSCPRVLVTHLLVHALSPWNLLILPHGLVGIPPPKDIPHELIGAKQCLRPSLKAYLQHLRSHTDNVSYYLLFPWTMRIKFPLKLLHQYIHTSCDNFIIH